MSSGAVIIQFLKRQTLIRATASEGLVGLFMKRSATTSAFKELTSRLSQGAKTAASKLGIVRDRLQPSKSTHQVLKLQLEAFWQRYHQPIYAALIFVATYYFWRWTSYIWCSVTNQEAHFSVNVRSLGLTFALVLSAFFYIRYRFGVDPETVYRLCLLQMNTHPGLLEVMGAPLKGSQLRAVVVSGGGLKLKGWTLQFQSRRVRMVFPVAGSHREGIAFLDVKKLQGNYMTKVLGVDVRLPDNQEQRIFLVGDSVTYSKGGVLAALEEPLHKSEGASVLDMLEDEQDEAEEQKKRAERLTQRQSMQEAKVPKSLDEGGGMYLYERFYWRLREASNQLSSITQRLWANRQSQ